MFKSVVYQGNSLLGEVEIYYPQNKIIDMRNKEIRITHLSQSSERCSPLAVLHTIAPCGVCFKLQSSDSPLLSLHSTCLRENKTAVMPYGEEELHLVAMSSRGNAEQQSRFWGFTVAPGLYNSCLTMLNLRCLGIVFDLDETLVVANTMRSFEDRIDSLQRKMNTELDPQRLSGMLAEVKRYQDDKMILKQYVESDQVVDNGKVIKVQSEAVPPLSDDHQPIVRPIIRLREKNIILTRINPLIRDTSVLVRLRPAWEDLRSYLTARGRKRFEVYVCTMAERDYALEMWRLLDPESNLINSTQLLDRIVCVKAGSRKSLVNVFHDGIFHPKMALVIDDRLKVWDEKDQPRVHVVPAFAPYYAPQAEANNVIPVLCVARNVACNVRGGFFKDFDEGLLQKISEVAYEDDLADFPPSPDVSDYLMSEDDNAGSGKNPLGSDGMADVEVERRLKDAVSSSAVISNLDPRHAVSLQPEVASILNRILQPNLQGVPVQNQLFPPAAPSVKSVTNVGLVEPSLPSSSSREEGEVADTDVDPDTRRRLLIWQHGQDTREQTSSEPTFPVRPPPQVPTPPPQVSIQPPQVPIRPPQVPAYSRGIWPQLEENISSRQLNQAVSKPQPKEFPPEQDTIHLDTQRTRHPSFFRGVDSSVSSDRFFHENQRFQKEAHRGDDRLKQNQNQSITKKRSFPVEDMSFDPSVSNNEVHPASALQNIAKKCRTTVEFKSNMIRSTELQFSIEAWFTGEKMGEGIGKTRREAQFQAAENALRHLSSNYLSNSNPDSTPAAPVDSNNNTHINLKENGFMGNLTSSVSVLKELCTAEGLSLVFQDHSPFPTNSSLEGESHAQVEIGGRVLGSGIGSTWDEAKMRAADEALETLKSMGSSSSQQQQQHQHYHHHHQQQQSYAISPRSSFNASKRHKVEFPRVLQRIPSSFKYSNNNNPSPVA